MTFVSLTLGGSCCLGLGVESQLEPANVCTVAAGSTHRGASQEQSQSSILLAHAESEACTLYF